MARHPSRCIVGSGLDRLSLKLRAAQNLSKKGFSVVGHRMPEQGLVVANCMTTGSCTIHLSFTTIMMQSSLSPKLSNLEKRISESSKDENKGNEDASINVKAITY
jgi:hypothetical protein